MGPRACIGQNFALLEAKIILAFLLNRFRFELVPGQKIVPETAVTIRFKHFSVLVKIIDYFISGQSMVYQCEYGHDHRRTLPNYLNRPVSLPIQYIVVFQ